jgi:hypothetical protein
MAGRSHDGMAPRTLLEHLLHQRDQTYEEVAARFEAVARSSGERATMTARHLRRLASGERGGAAPVTRRILQSMFNQPSDALLGPWDRDGSAAVTNPKSDREMLAMAAQRARDFTLAVRPDLTGEALDQLHDDVAVLAMAYPQRPLPQILGRLVDVQDLLLAAVEDRHPPQQARALLLLAGVTSGLLAKASHDFGDPRAALTQSRTALLCAGQADHPGARAWVRGIQALIAYWAGRYNESVHYSQQGAEYGARSTASVWLPVGEARAWAALGNVAQARAAIERAERARERVTPDELDELGGICTFGRPRQLYYAADAMVQLPDQAEDAERYSLDAVAAYRDITSPEWSFGDAAGSACDLAVARVQRGEVAGAAEAMAQVLDLPGDQRIHGVVTSARNVHEALTRAPASGPGTALQEQIEVFMRRPMQR